MTIWFTSDTHFGHANIIKYCERPFRDTDHMDAVIVDNWNSIVSPEDTVYHLGDVALGTIDKSLANVGRLNGYKILVIGNHDRPFMALEKGESELAYAKYNEWMIRYEAVFQSVRFWRDVTTVPLDNGNREFRVSHFPYEGDHTEKVRHMSERPIDVGMPLIHGHVHTKDMLTFSARNTPQIHVGMDAWNYFPVAEAQVLDVLDGIL
jgi:calcineurin-like phosphoesterase family protein